MLRRIDSVITKYLKKQKERVIFEVKIKNYSKANFYIALLYSERVDRYKVLYIPLDIVSSNNIYDYACYQFIDLVLVDYIKRSLFEARDSFSDEKFRNRLNEKIDSYMIEVNFNVGEEFYQFKTTRFIPKDWVFLFDIFVTLFEHLPHIVSGLCEDMLTLFKNQVEDVLYQESFEFDLLRDDIKLLKEHFKGKLLNFSNISYLEMLNNKYFAIICDHIVIIDYDKVGVLNTFCDIVPYNDYVYTVIEAIRSEVVKRFGRVVVQDKETAQYYLCYGLSDEGLRVIEKDHEKILPVELYKEGKMKFIFDDKGEFQEKIKGML